MTRGGARDEARAQAMRWLARREHSVTELVQRLSSKGYSSQDAADVVQRLRGEGLVSDRRFAESLLGSRVERGYGPVKIAHELKARGIDDELIDELLGDEQEYWLERLRTVWAKRYGRAPADYREWAKQARGLQARGFTAEQVRRVIPDIGG